RRARSAARRRGAAARGGGARGRSGTRGRDGAIGLECADVAVGAHGTQERQDARFPDGTVATGGTAGRERGRAVTDARLPAGTGVAGTGGRGRARAVTGPALVGGGRGAVRRPGVRRRAAGRQRVRARPATVGAG